MNTIALKMFSLLSLFFISGLLPAQKKKSGIQQTSRKDTITYRPLVMATSENLESLIREKNAVLVHYGFAPLYNPEFEKKYGVRIHNAGCIILPASTEQAQRNNLLVTGWLNQNFGNSWSEELGFTPMGSNP